MDTGILLNGIYLYCTKKKKKTIRKMHKITKTFSAREHRTQNTRGGVVVTPPIRTNQLPQERKKSPLEHQGANTQRKTKGTLQ